MMAMAQKQAKEVAVQGLYTHQCRLLGLHDTEKLSWRFISKTVLPYVGICHTTLRRISLGIAPKDQAICDQLGITRYAPAPVCPVHGVVHTGSCPRVGKRPRWVRDTVGYNDGHMGGGWR